MARFFKGLFRAVIGLVFGIASWFALIPALAAFNAADDTTFSSAAFGVLALLGILLGVFAPTIRRAFGRGFLLAGFSVFALPVSTLLLSGRLVSEMVGSADASEQGSAAIGSALAGTMATGLATIVGFFLGTVLIIIALVLLLGGRKEQPVIVYAAPGGETFTQIEGSRAAAARPVDISKWPKKDREARERAQLAARREPEF